MITAMQTKCQYLLELGDLPSPNPTCEGSASQLLSTVQLQPMQHTALVQHDPVVVFNPKNTLAARQ